MAALRAACFLIVLLVCVTLSWSQQGGLRSQSTSGQAKSPAPGGRPVETLPEQGGAKANAPKLDTFEERASYGVGLTIGRDLQVDGIQVLMPQFLAGIKDGLSAGPSRLTVEQLQECMNQLTTQLDAQRKAAHQEALAKNTAAGRAFLTANAKKPGVKVLPSGLQYQVLKSGTGATPAATDRIVAHYHGTLIDGTVFESSVQAGEPAEFTVSDSIPGWVEAVTRMKEGDKWRLFIPHELAYNDEARPPHIGPGTTLVFEVELVRVVK